MTSIINIHTYRLCDGYTENTISSFQLRSSLPQFHQYDVNPF